LIQLLRDYMTNFNNLKKLKYTIFELFAVKLISFSNILFE